MKLAIGPLAGDARRRLAEERSIIETRNLVYNPRPPALLEGDVFQKPFLSTSCVCSGRSFRNRCARLFQ